MKKNSEFNGVLSDFGDTLAYVDGEENQNYEREILSTLKKHGIDRNLADVSSAFETAYRNSMKGECRNMIEFWQFFLECLGVYGRSLPVKELESVRNRHSGTVFKLFDGVPQVLSTLQDAYRLALVSNCAMGTGDIIEALALPHFFNCVVLSHDVGVRKPHPLIYEKALECLDLKPSECVFVADEISDLEGASEVGMKTILVRQGSLTTFEANDPHFKPDFECAHISEITKFL